MTKVRFYCSDCFRVDISHSEVKKICCETINDNTNWWFDEYRVQAVNYKVLNDPNYVPDTLCEKDILINMVIREYHEQAYTSGSEYLVSENRTYLTISGTSQYANFKATILLPSDDNLLSTVISVTQSGNGYNSHVKTCTYEHHNILNSVVTTDKIQMMCKKLWKNQCRMINLSQWGIKNVEQTDPLSEPKITF